MEQGSDPRKWLEACPELAQFASDPELSAAIAAGDARRLVRALERRRKGRRGPFEARALDTILARRRLFIVPISKAPGLQTINGIGTSMFGKADAAPDGTHIATRFITFLFAPLFPLRSYLVWSAGRQYQFFGEVPLSRTMRLWRWTVGALAVAGLAVAAAGLWASASRQRVHFLNGLDVPIAVEVAGAKAELAPGGRAERAVATGRHHLVARAAGGRVVEELDVEVPRWTSLVAYNALGTAMLYVEKVVYSKDAPKAPLPAEEPVVYAGTSFVVRDGVSWVFQAAPTQLEVDSSKAREIRWRGDVAPGGWRVATGYLVDTGRASEAAALAGRVAQAEPGQADALSQWIGLTHLSGGPAAALEVARKAMEISPELLDVHRAYSHLMSLSGRLPEARKLYAERAARDPGSAVARYLAARLEPEEKARAAFADLVREHPDNPDFRRALGWAEWVTGRPEAAVREWDAFAKLDPERAGSLAEERADAMVRAGRAADAAREVYGRSHEKPEVGNAILYARVARLAAAPPAPAVALLEKWVAQAQGDEDRSERSAWAAVHAAAILGDRLPPEKELGAVRHEPGRLALRIMRAAASDPAPALSAAAGARREVLTLVPPTVLALLAGEAVRRGDAALAEKIAAAGSGIAAPASALAAFVKGEEPEELGDLAPELRAALLLVRARAAEAAGKPAGPIYAAARKGDALPGAVTVAAARWPRPARPAP